LGELLDFLAANVGDGHRGQAGDGGEGRADLSAVDVAVDALAALPQVR
jgi:hypothetical protein